jgi:NADH-quinone oxidoreductase subunit G
MPSFKLDDREIPFEPGDTIIRAAQRAGIDVPHYCWHPGLSVAANCRMCLVELLPPPGRPALQLDVLRWDPEKKDYVPEKKPKLVPACQQPAADGIQVKSDSSEHVKRARSAVQELLLLNHPVDCPICDQAGECRLQDYWLEHQAKKKRMRDEPIHKPKAVPFGPHIVYDAERCIVCTRCVRVSEELAKDPVLAVRERGNLNEIVLAQGRQLDHAYSLMTEYVCPVGALTSKEFRFKARVWFLRSARTICQGCATGCNAFLDYDPRNDTVHRHRPRENMAVNQYWMCDEGMLSYARVHENRVLVGVVKGKTRTREQAVAEAVTRLKGASKLAVVLSAQASVEDNYAIAQLGLALGAKAFAVSGKAPGEGDTVLRNADKNPNRRGVEFVADRLGIVVRDVGELSKLFEAGTLAEVLAVGSDLPDPKLAGAFGGAEVVVLAVHDGPLAQRASVVLPASSWAEYDGTYVNAKGLAQRSERAIRPKGESLPTWQLALQLAAGLGVELGWKKAAELRKLVQGEASDASKPGAAAGAEASVGMTGAAG